MADRESVFISFDPFEHLLRWLAITSAWTHWKAVHQYVHDGCRGWTHRTFALDTLQTHSITCSTHYGHIDRVTCECVCNLPRRTGRTHWRDRRRWTAMLPMQVPC